MVLKLLDNKYIFIFLSRKDKRKYSELKFDLKKEDEE